MTIKDMMPPTPTRPTIVAVIVTYNRLALLHACVEAVRSQDRRPDRIVVVDNASTDGTAEWLAAQPDLVVVRQSNCGSAGAYHSGFARALALGAEWVWGMDDDGLPEPGALAEVLRQAGRHGLDIVGALVVAQEDPQELAFRLRAMTRTADAMTVAEDGVVRNEVCLFNGTLLHRSVFETIGNLKREMFIWGEEWEYSLRARRAGLRIATAVNARHRHPRAQSRRVPVLGGRAGWVEELPEARAPFYFRNMGYIHATYEPALAIPRTLLKYALHHLVIRRDVAGFRRFADNYLAGAMDRYPEELKVPPTPLPVSEPITRERA